MAFRESMDLTEACALLSLPPRSAGQGRVWCVVQEAHVFKASPSASGPKQRTHLVAQPLAQNSWSAAIHSQMMVVPSPGLRHLPRQRRRQILSVPLDMLRQRTTSSSALLDVLSWVIALPLRFCRLQLVCLYAMKGASVFQNLRHESPEDPSRPGRPEALPCRPLDSKGNSAQS